MGFVVGPAKIRMGGVDAVNLTNHFLMAMPGMADPNFSHTLTYVCEHGEQGALGLIVNRPVDISLATLLERIELMPEAPALDAVPVYHGGPVQTERGFVLHRPLGNWQSTLKISDDVGLTSSRDILISVASEGPPEGMLMALGYAGWAAGQLEWELSQNAWLSVAADPEILFGLPAEERLAAAMQLLGVDPAHLSDTAGHA